VDVALLPACFEVRQHLFGKVRPIQRSTRARAGMNQARTSEVPALWPFFCFSG
jgi:hypothetical protein